MGDYYSVLGLTYGASKDEIKLAFRKLALQHHPDRHISSTKAQQEQAAVRFKAITEAYDVLTDDRKRAQYEASVRSGGGTTGSSYGNSGRYSYGYHSHNVNTDWAYSRYSHRDHARARISWFQQLQRVIGARKLEVGLTLAGVGLLLFCGPAVDAAWTARNQGKSFKDMQATRMVASSSSAAAAAAAPDGSSCAGPHDSGPGTAGPVGGSHRPKPYNPAVGCSPRHSVSSVVKQRRPVTLFPGAPGERHLAELPLAELLAAEAEACYRHNHHNRHNQQQQQENYEHHHDQEMERESLSSGASGGAGGAAIQGEGDLVQQQQDP